ncbi:MAG: ABC transporter ATP-binding protein [Bacillota bacterium]|nr:ABC transporter ATP-binding protein [Bacillota bacterium]MDW7677170.1 ABC transporter ATP-binding protein [Bacillota bacterium]
MSEVILEAKDICKYFGGLKAVEKVNMQVEKKDIFGIIGPNGAGKTTFFNVCSGIYKPTSGDILFKGESLISLKPEEIAKKGVARTFQNIQLFRNMSVLENVKIGFHNRTKSGIFDAIMHNKQYQMDEEMVISEGIAILKKVGLHEYRDTLAGNLAYGVQRRVEIARALALNPEIILLDEPAAGMNPIETNSLMTFIQELNREGYTIVVIEHDMKFIMSMAHKVLVLNFGQKISEGTPEQVQRDEDVIVAYFGKGLNVGGGH